jgi:hypothetical protein
MRRADVVKTFHEYNEILFGGRLQEPDVILRRMKTDLARWYSPDGAYPAGLLVLNTGLRHPMTWRSTLLHEMIHIATPEDEDHGTAFTVECNRVGGLIGLEPCDVSDSWNWPGHHELVVPLDGTVEWEHDD